LVLEEAGEAEEAEEAGAEGPAEAEAVGDPGRAARRVSVSALTAEQRCPIGLRRHVSG